MNKVPRTEEKPYATLDVGGGRIITFNRFEVPLTGMQIRTKEDLTELVNMKLIDAGISSSEVANIGELVTGFSQKLLNIEE